jgi:sugar phosphate isomerase/epimerase
MHLQLFRSLWTNGFNLDAALADCRSGAFDGVEGPVPLEKYARSEFLAKLRDSGSSTSLTASSSTGLTAGVPFIAEITTGGSYVPDNLSPGQHLDDFRHKAEASLECTPLFFTVLAGCDGWPLAQSVDFFGRAIEIANELGATASFETHRSRATFTPWTTRDLLRQLPALRLTCDFSHWCCVCERLVLDGELDILALCAERAHHIHARVGYDQGPQVPHPDAPEYHVALGAHERWWDAIWDAHDRAGRAGTTMTPEFGPDRYLHTLPFSDAPVASLDEINHWMAARQRGRFAEYSNLVVGSSDLVVGADASARPKPAA